MASTPDAAHVRGGGPGGERMPEGATPPPLGSNNTHQLDFYQAMVDFRVMFPNMDEEIIEAVLRANNGAVDATIDQLLTMNVDTAPTDPPPPPPSKSTPASHMEPPTYATVNKTTTPASWSIQKPVLADSTSSEDEDLPSYPQYQRQTESEMLHDYTNTDVLGAASSLPATNSAYFDNEEPVYANAASLMDDFKVVSLGNPVDVTQKPKAMAFDPANNFITPAPAFDPFDDPFFNTPAAPKAMPPPQKAQAVGSVAGVTPSLVKESPKQKLYKPRWNPPMLGELPEDFLRVVIESPVPTKSGSPHNSQIRRHVSRSNSQQASGQGEEVVRTSSKGSQRKSKSRSFKDSGGEQQQSPSHHHASHSPSTATLNSNMIAARIAENSRQRSEVLANTDKAQMLDDEMFALYLQNEEFLNDLRADEDFMRTLERERMNATAFEPADDAELDPNRPKKGQMEGYGEDDMGALGAFPHDKEEEGAMSDKDGGATGDKNDELRMQLKHMGGSSKKKLATLARRFFSRTKKKKSSKQMLKDSSLGPSKHNLLEEDPDSEGGGGGGTMGSLREDSESNLDTRGRGGRGGMGSAGEDGEDFSSVLTVQRPPYHPDCITTYITSEPDTRC